MHGLVLLHAEAAHGVAGAVAITPEIAQQSDRIAYAHTSSRSGAR